MTRDTLAQIFRKMTTAAPVKRPQPPSSSSSSTSKKSKKQKEQESSTPTAVVEETTNISITQSTSATRLIRHEPAKEILGQALLVDDDSVRSEQLQLLRNSNPARANQIMLQGGNERISYACRNFGNRAQPYKYAVALISPTNVRVWDAQVFATQRSISCVTEGSDDVVRLGQDAPTSAASLQMNYRDAQNLLGEAFGTRKRKQAIASAAKNEIKVEGLGGASVSFISENLASVAATAKPVEDAVQIDSATTALLPPFDKETAEVAQIYKISDLVPRDLFKGLPALQDPEALIAAGLKEGWLQRFQYIASRTSGAARDHSLRLCLFAGLLDSFRQLKEAAINGPEGSVAAVQKWIPGCSDEVAAHFLANFADPIKPTGVSSITAKTRHKLPPTSRDKAILYVLVLLLHLDNFRVNLTRASDLLGMPPTKLASFFKALGCAIEKPAKNEEGTLKIGDRLLTVKYARLMAPLKFPVPPKRK
jgi:DNA-directed RNA polymerase I subunit RPA49